MGLEIEGGEATSEDGAAGEDGGEGGEEDDAEQREGRTFHLGDSPDGQLGGSAKGGQRPILRRISEVLGPDPWRSGSRIGTWEVGSKQKTEEMSVELLKRDRD